MFRRHDPARSALLCLASLALLMPACASLGGGKRWGHPVTVSETVHLSKHGVPPDDIIAKMNRGGTVYVLGEEQITILRQQGVTPVVLEYMQTTYVQAVEAHPRLEDDEDLSCFYLGADGHWYGGGPEGFHPDC